MFDDTTASWGEMGWGSDEAAPTFGTASGVMSGIIQGTKVATAVGWQRVEQLSVGDSVLTFDNGLRTVRAIRRTPLWQGLGPCPLKFRPLIVPAGLLGNQDDMILLPRQGVLIESDVAETRTGDPFALLRAEELEGFDGVARVEPKDSMEVFVIQFDNDEVVFTAHGALCVCPAAGDLIGSLFKVEKAPEYHFLSDELDAELIDDILHEIDLNWNASSSHLSSQADAVVPEARVA